MRQNLGLEFSKSNIFLRSSFLLLVFDIFIYSRITYVIRIHDFAAILGLVFMNFLYFRGSIDKYNKKKIRLILTYILYILITNLTFFIINEESSFRFISIILKEFEYFIFYFILFYSVVYDKQYSIKILTMAMIVNIIYGLIQVVTNNITYYGIGSINSIYPSNSAAIYFYCFLLSYYLFLKYRKRKYIFITIPAFILTVATISKTNILGMIIFIVFFNTMIVLKNTMKKRKFISKINIIILTFMIILIFMVVSNFIEVIINNSILKSLLGRLNDFNNSFNTRNDKANQYINLFVYKNPILLLFGGGKGIIEVTLNIKGMAVDNQYVRALIEMGICGIVVWGAIVKKCIRVINNNVRLFLYAILFSYLFMGVGYEVFQVTGTGILFWSICGFIVGDNYLITNKRVIREYKYD